MRECTCNVAVPKRDFGLCLAARLTQADASQKSATLSVCIVVYKLIDYKSCCTQTCWRRIRCVAAYKPKSRALLRNGNVARVLPHIDVVLYGIPYWRAHHADAYICVRLLNVSFSSRKLIVVNNYKIYCISQ